MKAVLAALGFSLALAGCQTDAPTASGSPEITIPGARADQVKPQLVNALLNRGSGFALIRHIKSWSSGNGAARPVLLRWVPS